MRTRGISYVDWTVSMGLFIIVVLAVFIFLAPGAQPVYNHENLLDVVETNLLRDARWSVIKVPFFIHRLDKQTIEENPRPLHVELTYAPTLALSILEPYDGVVALTHSNLSAPPSVILRCQNPLGPSCVGVIVHFLFAPTTMDYPDAAIRVFCQPIGGPFCNIEPGASEFLDGFRESFVQAAHSYEAKKEQWNFPATKEFAVIVDDRPIIQGQQPSSQTNVFVRTKKYWILRSNGQRIPITISLRVW